MSTFRGYVVTMAVFAAVLDAALIIGVFGPVSLFTGAEVIPEKDAGVLLGPVMVATAVVALFLVLVARVRVPAHDQRVAVGGAVLAGVLCWAVYLVVGGAGYTLARRDAVAGLLFLGRQIFSPYALLIAVVSAVIAFLYTLVLASRVGERGRPRWPWES
jgi:hypothetical protein